MKYSKERTERICNAILGLKGRVGACKEAGISYDTFCEWMKKPEFSEAVKKAEAQAEDKGKEVAIMSIFNAMPKSWQAGAWWLERKYKHEFAVRSEQTGPDGKSLEFKVVLNGSTSEPVADKGVSGQSPLQGFTVREASRKDLPRNNTPDR